MFLALIIHGANVASCNVFAYSLASGFIRCGDHTMIDLGWSTYGKSNMAACVWWWGGDC